MRLHSDLKAAVRAATLEPDGDPRPSIEAALAPHARGWPTLDPRTRDELLHRARVIVHNTDAAPGDDSGLDNAVQAVLVRLALGELDRVVVVDIDADGLRAGQLHVGPDGIVTGRLQGSVVGCWDELLPGTTDPMLRRYLLAGGDLGGVPRGWRDLARFSGYAERYLQSIGLAEPDPVVELVLLRRQPGWRALDELAAALCERVPPGSDAVLRWSWPVLDELLVNWCSVGPLRRGCELAVATIDPADGRIGIATEPLFRAGVPAGPDRRTSIVVQRPDSAAGSVLLPVLQASDADLADRPVVAMLGVTLSGPATLDFVMRRPGQVEVDTVRPFRAPPGTRAAVIPTGSGVTWRDVVARLPQHDAFDVAIGVEVSGDPERAEPRIEAAREVVRALEAREQYAPGAVRVAAVGFADHSRAARDPGPIRRLVRFGPPAVVLAALAEWAAAPQNSAYGSALEDGLNLMRGLDWRSGALHTLVTIGSRPPCVLTPAGTSFDFCPGQHDWRAELAALRKLYAVRTVAIVDLPPWFAAPDIADPVERTREVWDELGRDASVPLADLDVGQLARTVTPGPVARVPLAVALRTENEHG